MNNDILRYYHDELNYLRQAGSDFARHHPKTASLLRLDNNANADPFVERLLESFAFLTANIQQQFDQGYKDFAEQILTLLYPEVLLPIPAMTTLKLSAHSSLKQALLVPRHTELDTIDKIPCRFQTCYDVNLLPLDICAIHYRPAYLEQKRTVPVPHCKAYLHLKLKTQQKSFCFDANSDSLRFHINPQQQYSNLLYHYLFTACRHIGWVTANEVQTLATTLQPVGFAADEGLLPLANPSQQRQRLLVEYSTFPQKYQYFVIDKLSGIGKIENEVELVLCFDEYLPELKKALHDESIVLHCTPCVNIFKQSADIATSDSHNHRHHVSLDKYDAKHKREIYRVLSLHINDKQKTNKVLRPLFAQSADLSKNEEVLYWQSLRKPAWQLGGDTGDEVFIELNESNLDIQKPKLTLTAEVLATDRDRPHLLPFGGNRPKLQLSKQESGPYDLQFLTQPTVTRRHNYQHEASWQILAYLTSSHDMLSQGHRGVEGIKRLLRLANCGQQDEIALFIQHIIDVNTKVISAPLPLSGELCFVTGTELTITLSRSSTAKTDFYPLGCVLSQYFSAHCTINSFIQLRITMQQVGEVGFWPPVFGQQEIMSWN